MSVVVTLRRALTRLLTSDEVDDNFEGLADAFNGLGTASAADVTTSSSDTTAGRVLKTGDLGSNRHTIEAVDWNDLPTLYPYSGPIPIMPETGGANAPDPGNYYHVHQDIFGGGSPGDNCTQIAVPYVVGSTPICTRSRYNGTWTQWLMVVTADGITAAMAKFTPAGGLQSTNVQAALVELDTEKAPTSAETAAGTSVEVATSLPETDVQAALERFARQIGSGSVTDILLLLKNIVGSDVSTPLNVVAYGGNGNGNWVRFAGGLQVCWLRSSTAYIGIPTAYGNLYQGTWNWTFPAAFAAAPVVPTPAVIQGGTAANWASIAATPSTTGVVLRVIDVSARAAASSELDAIAIGAWK